MNFIRSPHPYIHYSDELYNPQNDWMHGTYITAIPTLHQARHLLGTHCQVARQLKSQTFRSKNMRARSYLSIGRRDKAEEYVVADGDMQDDGQSYDKDMPILLKVMRYQEYKISAGENLDVTANAEDWCNANPRATLHVYLHFDKLSVHPSSQITVRGNVLFLRCDHLIMHRDEKQFKQTSKIDLQINILGTEHHGIGVVRDSHSYRGNDGVDGVNGIKPMISELTKMTPTLFGPMNLKVNKHRNFSHTYDSRLCGGIGSDGDHGGHGANGGRAMLADLRIGIMENFKRNSCRIHAQANDGYKGGNGGDGGHGGDGNVAGNGGDGGHGGHGGNGGLASNVFIETERKNNIYFDLNPVSSSAGAVGKAGRGGKKGRSICMPTSGFLIPRDGEHGVDGRQGKTRKPANIYFIN